MTPRTRAEPPELADCVAVERVLAILGRAWAGAVLTALQAGRTRYGDLRHALDGVSDSTLTARLKELCSAGLAVRVVEPGPPVAVTYELTDAGRGTAPVLAALVAYARTHHEIVASRGV